MSLVTKYGMTFPYAIVDGKTKGSADLVNEETGASGVAQKTIDNIKVLNYTYKGQLPVNLDTGSIFKEFGTLTDFSQVFTLFFVISQALEAYVPEVEIVDLVFNEDAEEILLQFKVQGSTEVLEVTL